MGDGATGRAAALHSSSRRHVGFRRRQSAELRLLERAGGGTRGDSISPLRRGVVGLRVADFWTERVLAARLLEAWRRRAWISELVGAGVDAAEFRAACGRAAGV